MEINETQQGNVIILKPEGRLDSAAVPFLSQKLQQLINDKKIEIAIDFSAVEQLNSDGLRILLMADKRIKAVHGSLMLCALSDELISVLKISGFIETFTLYQRIDDIFEKTTTQISKVKQVPTMENSQLLSKLTQLPRYLYQDNIFPLRNNTFSQHALAQEPLFPFHRTPSILQPASSHREPITYNNAIQELSCLLLQHRQARHRIHIYVVAQLDYLAMFAIQEVFRLLGVRHIHSNTQLGAQAQAYSHTLVTGQETPYLTVEKSIPGEHRLFILSGWNGIITNPDIFHQIQNKNNYAYLIDVLQTETADSIMEQFGAQSIVLLKSGTDPLFALSIAHEILQHHPDAINTDFLNHYADTKSLREYIHLISQDNYQAIHIAPQIAADESYQDNITTAISQIARLLAQPEIIPIHIPSMGLAQSSGMQAYALWDNLFALVGKLGLHADGSVAGGSLRITGQSNTQGAIQALAPDSFFARIPINEMTASDVSQRLGLPEESYRALLSQPALSLHEDLQTQATDIKKELFIFFGTQFEANLPHRQQWLQRLQNKNSTFIVIDPIPDPFSIEHAYLLIPSNPDCASSKVLLNGDNSFSLQMPERIAGAETRTDLTIIYDLMANITEQLNDTTIASAHPDLSRLHQLGYLQARFVAPNKNLAHHALTIGRSPKSDITLTHPTISWEHASIHCVDKEKPLFKIKDLGSSNGTFKNNKRINKTTFTPEDTITVGAVTLVESDYSLLLADHDHNVGLLRQENEVNRPQIWQRILDYTQTNPPLYCLPQHADKTPIQWQELLLRKTIPSQQTNHARLTYSLLDFPFRDKYQKAYLLHFFIPAPPLYDTSLANKTLLITGRAAISKDPARTFFAQTSFNSGKTSNYQYMPQEHPLYVSPALATIHQLATGDTVQITLEHNKTRLLPIVISDRLHGNIAYMSFHKSLAQIEQGHYCNDLLYDVAAYCPYTDIPTIKKSYLQFTPVGTLSEDKKQALLHISDPVASPYPPIRVPEERLLAFNAAKQQLQEILPGSNIHNTSPKVEENNKETLLANKKCPSFSKIDTQMQEYCLQLESEKKKLEQKIKQLQAQLNENQQISITKQAQQPEKQQISVLQQQINTLQQQLQQAEKRYTYLKQQISTLIQEN